MIEVEIDKGSGFCFGVVNAIESAERELKNTDRLYCLGDIVHNSLEVERLEAAGLRTIDHEVFAVRLCSSCNGKFTAVMKRHATRIRKSSYTGRKDTPK